MTAYNHGAAGVMRGVKSTESYYLSKLISQYRSRTFGFASKDFYAEFLAARKGLSIQEQAIQEKGRTFTGKTGQAKKLPLKSLIRKTPLSTKMVRRYNPCIDPKAFRRSKAFLPRNYELYVPRKLAMRVNPIS